MTPPVTAIIVNYHSAAMTLRAVASLQRQRVADLDVVVVDNSESAAEAELLQRASPGRFRLIVNRRNEGFGRACNRAWRDSDGGLVLLLNPDAWLRDGALGTLVSFLAQRSDAAAAAPVVSMDDAGEVLLPPSRLPSPWDPVRDRLLAAFPVLAGPLSRRERRRALALAAATRPLARPALSGAVVLLRRTAVEPSGGLFDSAYPLYYEDSDLFRRLRAHGWRLFLVPGARAVHHYDQCGRSRAALKRELGAAAWRVYTRRYDPHGHARRALAWMERLLPGPRHPRLETQAPGTGPPARGVPDGRGPWALEISHNPWFSPAALQRGRGPQARLSDQAWALLAPGEYFCRVGGLSRNAPLRTWRVVKPATEETMAQHHETDPSPGPRPEEGGTGAADAAQTLLHERVTEALHAHPARVAVLGSGTEDIAATLTAGGHHVHALDEPGLSAHGVPAAQAFDLVVMSHPPLTLDPLEWLRHARQTVDENGELLFEGPLGRGFDTVEGRLSAHDYLLAVAERTGWIVTGDDVIGPARGRPGGGGADLRLISFTPGPAPRWSLGYATPRDFDAIARLFEDVFGHPLTRQLWAWKYTETGGAAVLSWRGDRLVGHYGGMPRRIRRQGRPTQAVQIGDVMVRADERGVLTRRGPFFLTTATFLERYIGEGRSCELGFGFPNARHQALAARLGLYEAVDHIAEVAWSPLSAGPRIGSRIRPLDAGRDAAAVDRLWSEMAADFEDGIIGVRDFEHIEYRYLRHPARTYQPMLVCSRLGGRPRALLVLRTAEGRCELLDVVAPLRRMPEAIHHARRVCARLGARELYLWVTKHNVARLPGEGVVEVRDPDIVIPTSAWHSGTDPDGVRERWWITGGDSDFR